MPFRFTVKTSSMKCLNLRSEKFTGQLTLPASKSISNRLLILKAVLKTELVIENGSSAKDTLDLQTALQAIHTTDSATLDVGHAGTDLRFLTALLSTCPGEWLLTGSERLQQRPIKELVSALQHLGATISYVNAQGFAPLQIKGQQLLGGSVELDASVSSQFISALLMVAPRFKNGLTLTLKGKVVSASYITMTLALMRQLDIEVSWEANVISVKPLLESELHLKPRTFFVESDWSSASYWMAFVALSQSGRITLSGLEPNSLQGDAVIIKLAEVFGVSSTFNAHGLVLQKDAKELPECFEYDFTNCPDIAQTLVVLCCALGIEARCYGLETLVGKETNRLLALQTELKKLNVEVQITENSLYLPNVKPSQFPKQLEVETYNDHRMAMCMALLAMRVPQVCIKHPEVVDKSYPTFWEDVNYIFLEGNTI